MGKEKALRTTLLGASLVGVFGIASATEPGGVLLRVDGTAIVSKGAQYVRGHEGMMLKEGDRILVMEGGTAVISFADGCRYTLTDEELFVVGPASTCVSGAAGSYRVDPYSGVSQGPSVYRQAALEPPTPPKKLFPPPPAMGGAPWVPYAIGAVVLGGAALGASDSSGDNGVPLSP